MECVKKNKNPPNLIVAILPDGATDLYSAIKQYAIISLPED